MWERPAPWGPSTTRARWNREIVSCRLALLPLNTTSSSWGKDARMAAGQGRAGGRRIKGADLCPADGWHNYTARTATPAPLQQQRHLSPASSACSLATRREASPARDTYTKRLRSACSNGEMQQLFDV